jgi:hypothetical protein
LAEPLDVSDGELDELVDDPASAGVLTADPSAAPEFAAPELSAVDDAGAAADPAESLGALDAFDAAVEVSDGAVEVSDGAEFALTVFGSTPLDPLDPDPLWIDADDAVGEFEL